MKKLKEFIVKGNGSSIWGESNKEYIVNKINIGFDELDCYEQLGYIYGRFQLYGKRLKWYQYTDNIIEWKINRNKQIKDLIYSQLPKEIKINKTRSKISISWSEQGMQPDNGWDFDFKIVL